jgi:hypothetical protein
MCSGKSDQKFISYQIAKEEKRGGEKMKKVFLLILLVSCSGCALLAANPQKYTYPYPDPHPCVYPCEHDNEGHIIYHTEND